MQDEFAAVEGAAKSPYRFLSRCVAASQCNEPAPQFELRHHMTAQDLQGIALIGRNFPRYIVDHAQGAKRLTAGGDQGCPRIEADFRIIGDQWTLHEALVLQCIRNHEDVDAADGVGTKSYIARRLADRKPHLSLEPLAIAVHETHQRDRRSDDGRGQAGKLVKDLLRGCIEDVIGSERQQPAQLGGDGLGIFRGWGYRVHRGRRWTHNVPP